MPKPADTQGQPPPGRLLLLSNRLPITIKRSGDASYSFSMSSGGLVTGLSGLGKTTSFQWYGWPGLEVPESDVEGMKKRLNDEYGAHPVFIDDELADRHYNGFSSTPALPHTKATFSHADPGQTRSCGPSSTTIPAKSHLTSPPGQRTRKSTASSPRPSSRTSRTAT